MVVYLYSTSKTNVKAKKTSFIPRPNSCGAGHQVMAQSVDFTAAIQAGDKLLIAGDASISKNQSGSNVDLATIRPLTLVHFFHVWLIFPPQNIGHFVIRVLVLPMIMIMGHDLIFLLCRYVTKLFAHQMPGLSANVACGVVKCETHLKNVTQRGHH